MKYLVVHASILSATIENIYQENDLWLGCQDNYIFINIASDGVSILLTYFYRRARSDRSITTNKVIVAKNEG